MLDDFREWLSDNLRYLLLGLAVILLLIIVFFAVRLVTGFGKGGDHDTERETEQRTEQATETDAEVSLTQNVQEILDVMSRYYTARADQDVDTLREIYPGLSAEDEADIQNNNPIERYDNITVYSREGLTEGSYIAYVSFDAKLVGIDTLAPTLNDVYLETDTDGNLIIVDKFGTQERTEFVEMMRATDAVQDLIQNVNQRLSEAAASDADLEAYIVAQQSGSSTDDGSEDDSGDGADADSSSSIAADSTVTATTTVNVRSEASTNGVLYGTLTEGAEATVLEVLDSGWCKIQYTTSGVTIEGYVMTQYLTAAE